MQVALYDRAACDVARLITNKYSTSFSLASKLFDKTKQQHIYNIYGLVRAADEIVDTYRGANAAELLDSLQKETEASLVNHYSNNPVVHAFQITAAQYGIGKALVKPFFDSMRRDLIKTKFNEVEYQTYIYGSAEVVGLMCLQVFLDGQTNKNLAQGARALGAAFQKINFLRDMGADHHELGRFYFPHSSFAAFDETAKQAVINDIAVDLDTAKPAMQQLPNDSRYAVMAACAYYERLLGKLRSTPVTELKHRRVRVSNYIKAAIFVKYWVLHYV